MFVEGQSVSRGSYIKDEGISVIFIRVCLCRRFEISQVCYF